MLLRRLFQKCYYATTTEGSAQVMKLTFVCPHKTVHKNLAVKQINISTSEGDMGILAGHVPSILQLRPGALVVIPESNRDVTNEQKEMNADEVFFVSGGFVTVNSDSTVQVTALEAVKLEEISKERVEIGLKDAQERINRTSNKSVDDPERVDAQIHAEVFQALSYTLGKYQQ